MKRILPLIMALLQALTAASQDDLVFTRYSHLDGLPASFTNTRMVMDQTGYLWIYTEQGFVRYDGYSFRMYPFRDAEIWGKSMTTGYPMKFGGFERFYITIDRILYVYNPLINSFNLYDLSSYIGGGMEPSFTTIDDSKNHCIWVTGENHLFKLSYLTGNIKEFDSEESTTFAWLIPGNKILYKAWGDSLILFDIETGKFSKTYFKDAKDMGSFFADYFRNGSGNENQELISKVIFSNAAKKIFWFSSTTSLSPKTIESQTPLADFSSIYEGVTLTDSFDLWTDLGQARLLHVNLRTGKKDTLDIKTPGYQNKDNRITAIVKDGDNEMWLACANNGLIRVNPLTKKVTQYLSIADNPNSLWSNNTFGLICHKSGALWLNQPSYGLVKIEKKRNVFLTIAPLADEFTNLRSSFEVIDTRMFLPLDSNRLLVGTFGKLSDINVKTGKVDLVHYDDNSIVKELTSTHSWGSAARDQQGNIFIGTWDAWLFVYNPHLKTCRSFYSLSGGPQPVKSAQAYRAMLVDSRNVLWIGSNQGLFRIKTEELLSNPSPNIEIVNTGDSSNLKTVFTLMMDRSKNVWVGSTSGIKVFSPDGKMTSYSHAEGKNSLSFNEVRCFAEDKDGNIWIATCGGGLNKFDVTTHQFTVYTTKDRLPDDVIYSLLIDKENNLWLASNLGLSKFNPTNHTVNNFSPFDGLQGYEFNTNAFCTMPGGELVFGGPAGMTVFKPEAIAVSSPAPDVVLSSFKVMGEEAVLDSGTTCLSYKQDNLSFQFAAISYYRSAGNQFAYKLEGLDEDWVYSGNRPYVTYSHVPPGDYTFKVKAANSSGVWNEKGIAYKISVTPPWWSTWWFRSAAVLLIASAIYFLYRYQLRQALKLQAIRNSIATDLHDEIGSTLSSISIYSQVAKKEVIRQAPGAAAMLENITESTTGMMDAMNDIVWMINSRNDRFENITDRMNAFANELLEAKNCNVHLHISPELEKLRLNMSQRKNLYLIFKEAINNVAKYADCRNVWIDLSMNGSHKIVMMIRDDGKGFDMNVESTGNGLHNMQKRAAEVNGKFHFNSKVGEGTMVKLEFSL